MGDEQLAVIARELVTAVRRNATIDWAGARQCPGDNAHRGEAHPAPVRVPAGLAERPRRGRSCSRRSCSRPQNQLTRPSQRDCQSRLSRYQRDNRRVPRERQGNAMIVRLVAGPTVDMGARHDRRSCPGGPWQCCPAAGPAFPGCRHSTGLRCWDSSAQSPAQCC